MQSDFLRPFELDSDAEAPYAGVPRRARLQRVSSNYFTAMKVGLLQGRLFRNEADTFEEGTVVVNRSFAEQFLRPRSLGREIAMRRFFPGRRFPIVGVVEDTFESVSGGATPTIYMSSPLNWMYLLVRISAPEVTPRTLRDVVKAVSPSVAIDQVSQLEDAIGTPIARVKVQLALVVTFALVALGLAAIGIFTTLSLSVTDRMREFGIRAALRAAPSALAFAVFRSMLAAVAGGAIVGILIMLVVNRLMVSLIPGVRTNGLAEIVLVCVSLLASCIAAGWTPVRRITRVNPSALLKIP